MRLGHLMLIRAAERGGVSGLVRYRSESTCVGLHQDPVEEKLCNAFATSLLMPTSDLIGTLCRACIGPHTIHDLSKTFDTSIHMTARKVVTLLGEASTWCSLWDLKTLWPVPVWECGMKSIPRRDFAGTERLATACTKSGRAQGEIWPSFGKRRHRYKVEIAPLPTGRVALCFASPSFEGLASCNHRTDGPGPPMTQNPEPAIPKQLTLW